ncbi:membrane protease YdiL (CAAX protease family) [Pseudarthrobacter sp. PvP004]|uniref:CPBP family intramembrane glutamic endopeptidase n=1 Tax=Pseudarthrobacter sp. PvP004 TaxID=2817850 RepID=UPI001AEA50D7|nr:CPBP family glutamic-type intramembrane protease [Pseudarthrobacter sp. PvP004]MBP2268865.1 membrane protease YdiL (CAAX protease family) [Pseudarthrobacter sp. PvP004]
MGQDSLTSGWKAFWNRGGWWRSLLLVVLYMAFYLGAGLPIGAVAGDQIDTEDIFRTPQSVFFGITFSLIVGSVVLLAFLSSTGWLRPLFAPQPIKGKWWMWVAPFFLVVAIVLRFLGIDYGSYEASVVVVTLLTGLLIGFAEEVLTRGIVVKMLRDSGKSEWVVMVLSSLIFALLHAANALSGQPIATVLVTVGFTFGFGICMYLTLRVTGNLIWPIILHALYDPTLFLATGGIDQAAAGPQSPFLVLAGPANMIYILIALVALIVVRGKVQRAPLSEPVLS